MSNTVINFEELLEKRGEVLGDKGRFPVEVNGKVFHIVAPDLADDEFQQKLSNLRQDLVADAINFMTFSQEMVELYLVDQADEFREAVNASAGFNMSPVRALNMILENRQKQLEQNPTRRDTSRTRRR